MTDLKLLFSRYFSHKRILIGVAAFFLLMMAAVMLFHEDPGGDPADFIMCKFSALMPMMMAVCLPVIFMVQARAAWLERAFKCSLRGVYPAHRT